MIFAKLFTENTVQENDKTRLLADDSFVTPATATPIASVTITPGKGVTPIVITNANSKLWILDYQFAFLLDVDATNNKLDFSEGAGELTATVSTNSYTLADLAAEIKTQLDAAGALTYTVSVTSDDSLTISAPTEFELLSLTGTSTASLWGEIGFPIIDPNDPSDPPTTNDQTGDITYTGNEIETVNKLITLLASDGSNDNTVTKTLKLISPRADRLFSDDAMLTDHEHDIRRFIVQGRDTFKNKHRLAQTQIFDYMDKEGMVNIFDKKYKKQDALIPEEFRQWSKFLTLRLIFDGISNKADDVFFKKARHYQERELFFRNRSVIRLDIDRDKKVDLHERIDATSGSLFRR